MMIALPSIPFLTVWCGFLVYLLTAAIRSTDAAWTTATPHSFLIRSNSIIHTINRNFNPSTLFVVSPNTKHDSSIVHSSRQQQRLHRQHQRRSTPTLYNVPPPMETDLEQFKLYASKQSPPASFYELQQDCIRAVRLARRDGIQLLEIEYPPLPANVLEMDDVSTYDVLQANMKLAIDLAKGTLLSETEQVQKITILLPDQAETELAMERVTGGSDNPFPGIHIASIRRSTAMNDTRIFQPEQLLLGLFGRSSGGAVQPVHGTDVYICVQSSAQELPDIEELYTLDPTKTIIFFNMKLDILRGDLGAPAFPPKQFHDRFLSRVKPVYYLRTRQYSRSTTNPPFVVNFQGCLFRSYPGQYQTLLDTGNGKYRRIVGNDIRPALGQFKQELIDELTQQGVLVDEGKTLSFLRTGYKTTTWWEEERLDADNAWKT